MTNTEAAQSAVSVIAARYTARVDAAVEFARTDEFFQRYNGRGWDLACSIRLADQFGTWVAHDAMKKMGLR